MKEQNEIFNLDNLNYLNYLNSYSQAKQDLFAIHMLKSKKDGTFLDIGCGHPYDINNTYLLENKFDWSGICIDINNCFSNIWKERKKSKFINDDALNLNYYDLLENLAPNKIVDYLSLDLEPPSLTFECLSKLPLKDYTFSAITFEHDCYRCGNTYKTLSRSLFNKFEYILVASDIGDANFPFEDWYIHKSLL